MGRVLAIVASALTIVLTLLPGQAAADSSWLGPTQPNWNRPGMAVSKAPPRDP